MISTVCEFARYDFYGRCDFSVIDNWISHRMISARYLRFHAGGPVEMGHEIMHIIVTSCMMISRGQAYDFTQYDSHISKHDITRYDATPADLMLHDFTHGASHPLIPYAITLLARRNATPPSVRDRAPDTPPSAGASAGSCPARGAPRAPRARSARHCAWRPRSGRAPRARAEARAPRPHRR